MILTKEQIEQFKEASKPLVKFLCENCNPHTVVHVDCVSAEIFLASAKVKIEEFIKD